MLKKYLFSILLVIAGVISVFAYNPPMYGEDMYNFVSPEALSFGNSVTGGAIQSVAVEDIAVNPALVAGEQRFTLKLSGSLLFQSNEAALASGFEKQKGGAAQLGMLFPSRIGVADADFQFVSMTQGALNFGNSFMIRGAFAKDLIDDLYVGMGLYGSFGDNWSVGADLGLWCNLHTIKWLPFMSDCRWACAVTGLGKAYNPNVRGLYGENSSGFPSPFTIRMGFAGNLMNFKNFKTGLSLDLSFPYVQNVVFNCALDFLIFNVVSLKTGWEFNMRETIQTQKVIIPSASLSCKFNFTTSKKDDSIFVKQGWSKSEMDISGGYRYIDGNIHAASAGVTIRAGQKDNEKPVIILWGE